MGQMTKDLMHQVRIGSIPDDDDLKAAVEFFGRMVDGAELLGPAYQLFAIDLRHTHSWLSSAMEARKRR